MSVAFAQVSLEIRNDTLFQLRKEANRDFIHLYKENAELSYTSPKGEIGAPGKYIINGKLTTTYMLLASSTLPVAFAVVPDFTVRVRDERSSGVRTPSFRLGGILYLRLNTSLDNYKYASLRFTHHSNGQDGQALNSDKTINTINGNFSTNYLTLAYNFGSIHFGYINYSGRSSDLIKQGSGRSSLNKKRAYYSLNHELGFEWHKWFSYEKALENDYGFTRLIYNFSLRRYENEKENWRLNAGLNYAVNPMTGYQLMALKKRLNTEASFHYSFPFMNNVFIMAAAGYYGEDPYNIYYRDKYGYLRFGISSGFLRNKRR